MPGESSSTQTSQQTRQPWAESLPALRSVLGDINSLAGTAGLTGTESGALDTLTANAQRGNPYAPQIGSLATDLLSGGTDRTGTVLDAYSTLRNTLTPIARGDYLDPSKNPFFSTAATAIGNDAQKRITDMYVGAGRDPATAGNFAPALGKAITDSIAPLEAQIYETERQNQQNAIDRLLSGATATTGLLSNLDQTALQNRQAGLGVSNASMAAQNYTPSQLLEIEAKRRGIPLSAVSALTGMIAPIAGLGGTTSGTSTTDTTTFNPMQVAQLLLGGGGGGGGGAGAALSGLGSGLQALGTGAGAGASALLSALGFLSDVRVKDNIAPIGALFDGTPVYSFNYIGDRTPRMGLIAQDVERRAPDAVANVGGIKTVNYGKATQRARRIGGLLDHLAYRRKKVI
jgi:endosialidase-like protein